MAGTEPPLSTTDVAAATAVTTPGPQVVAAFAGVATTMPGDSASVNASPVKGAAFGLAIRTVISAKAPGGWVVLPVVKPAGLPVSSVKASKALFTTSGLRARTVSLVGSELEIETPPEVPLMAPAGMVLV